MSPTFNMNDFYLPLGDSVAPLERCSRFSSCQSCVVFKPPHRWQVWPEALCFQVACLSQNVIVISQARLRGIFFQIWRKYLLGLKEELFWFGGPLHLTRHVFVQNLEIYILIFPKSHTNVDLDKMITFDNHKVKCQLFLPLFSAVPQDLISLWPFFTFGWMLRWCQRCRDLLCCQISHLWSILVLVEFLCVL